MTHPEELLAGYVDGTLGTDERAVVDAHLQTCDTCREEVGLARTAVRALATLEEMPVPFGVTGPVLAEAGRRFERRRAAIWGRVQWAAGAAAAAALVLVVALNLNLGGGDDESANRAAADGGGGVAESAPEQSFAAAEVRLERQDANYDAAGVQILAEDSAQRVVPPDEAAGGAGATGATGQDAVSAAEAALDLAGPGPAITCLRTSGAPVREPTDTLVRLIEAEFEQTPAYFAVFLESPGAGQPADTVVVWVTAKGNCGRILTIASKSI